MLQCNLRVILAQMKRTATKVSNDTGISRVTLGALINNQAKGVQFDTINTLCTYLGVDPGRLFAFAPFDVTVDSVSVIGHEVVVLIHDAGRDIRCRIPTDICVETQMFERWSVPHAVYVELCEEDNHDTEVFKRYYRMLTQDLKMHVLDLIENAVLTAVEEDLPMDFPDGIMNELQIEARVCGEM